MQNADSTIKNNAEWRFNHHKKRKQQGFNNGTLWTMKDLAIKNHATWGFNHQQPFKMKISPSKTLQNEDLMQHENVTIKWGFNHQKPWNMKDLTIKNNEQHEI